uniref:Uncharacterized protein LOC104266703 n=1 Tax=Phallusia mammillata TaxID=59560 RepID=A0A6F9DJZ9_9ASCI|nr:uncharacterized protein LOC104266703 [Phallusia mammillata]
MNCVGVNIGANAYETIEMNEGQHNHAPANTVVPVGFWETSSNVYEKPISKFHGEISDTLSPKGASLQEYEKSKIQSNKTETKCVQKRSFSKLNIIWVCVFVILAALAIVFAILYFRKDQKEKEEVYQVPVAKSPLGTFPNPASSCIELRDAGFKNGIYVIKTTLKSFEAYCDMLAAGGGWILAATINNINFNTTGANGGSWFLMTSNNHQNYLNYQNWMNTNTFGTFDNCTRSDFKSQAYSEYQGKDIMLRHVLNQTPLGASREQVFLQYQTENGFMKDYGGNLHNLFNNHYPLKPTSVFYPKINLMLDRFVAQSSEIRNHISDFYYYDYSIHSSGLFDDKVYASHGMVVYSSTTQSCYPSSYKANCQLGSFRYGLDYTCDLGNMFRSSRKTHPFIALFAVGNFDHCFSNINLWVLSFRPNTDSIHLYKGNQTLNNFFLHYEAQCRYGSSHASLCDVWFYVINTENWNSSAAPTTEPYKITHSSHYYFGWRIREAVSNTLFGYTMIARKNGVLIPGKEIKAVMYKILEIISETDHFCPNCSYDDVISVPVQFSIGNDLVVNSMLPPGVKPLPTGFVQFRAYGRAGSVYAMCPAVK